MLSDQYITPLSKVTEVGGKQETKKFYDFDL
jgi:hypothetical protein